MRARPGLLGGSGAATAVALALLVAGCMFVALAGPRASLDLRDRALQRELASAPQADKAIGVSTGLFDFDSALTNGFAQQASDVTPDQLDQVKNELADGLAADGLPLGPLAAAWLSLAAPLSAVPGAAASAQAGGPPQIEVIYRDSLARDSQLAAGRYPGAASAPGPARGPAGIAVTQQTAARFSLHPGSRLVAAAPTGGRLTLVVTGIVRPRDPRSAFWMADALAAAPALQQPLKGPRYWIGAAFAGAGGTGALQNAFGPSGIQMSWEIPLSLGHLDADHAQALDNLLNGITTQRPALTGALAPAGSALTITAGLSRELSAFLTTQAAAETVLSLLFTGLAAVGAIVLLLAAWMVTARRAGDYGLMRARGTSLRWLTAVALRDTAVAVIPAVLLGAAAAVALTPGGSPPLAVWLAGVTAVLALAGPPLAAAGQHRQVRPGGQGGTGHPPGTGTGPRRRYAPRRWVAETALAAAAIGGLIVLRRQGLPPAGQFNAYTSAAPVLVAIPAAVCVLRLYPLALRGMLRLTARRAGVTGFLAAARAGRAPAASVLPSFALVLALSLAAFAGMVRDTVSRGENLAAWRATGADAVVNAEDASSQVTPAAVRALSAVPGVRHAAAVRVATWTMPGSRPVTVIAVAPARYAALVASTPWPAFPAARLAAPAAAAAPVLASPVLASPAAAAVLGTGVAQLQADPGSLLVRVAGVLSGTPALPAGGSFLVLPLRALPAAQRSQPVNLMLMTGPGLDERKLTAIAGRLVPGADVRLRSAALKQLSDSPLSRGASLGFAAGIAAAAGFSVVILLLDLALGAAERRVTLARLAALGLGAGQARRLTLLERLPAVLAAAVAGTCCAWAMAPVTGPALSLAVFTGSAASVPVRPDFLALALPAAGLLVLAVGTLLVQIRLARRHGVAGALRLGQ